MATIISQGAVSDGYRAEVDFGGGFRQGFHWQTQPAEAEMDDRIMMWGRRLLDEAVAEHFSEKEES